MSLQTLYRRSGLHPGPCLVVRKCCSWSQQLQCKLQDSSVAVCVMGPHCWWPIFFQVVSDSGGAVFGGFSSSSLVASNKRKYQVISTPIIMAMLLVPCALQSDLCCLQFPIWLQGTSDTFVFSNVSGESVVHRSSGRASSGCSSYACSYTSGSV